MEVIELKYRAFHDYLAKRCPPLRSALCEEGYIGLLPRSRAPKRIHKKLPEEDELLIIDAKLRDPSAGARRVS